MKRAAATSDVLRPFEMHGVEWQGTTGNQAVGRCPFTDKDRKFYVNTENGLWDSKTAGISGNVHQFLEHKARFNQENLSRRLLRKLAKDRGLPPEAFEGVGLGHDGNHYTIPFYDRDGKLVDLRLYTIGKRPITTKGMKPGLLFAPELGRDGEVWICEGEWDAIALRWLAKSLGKKVTVVGVPGASSFLVEWVDWLRGRDVVLAYDHDQAGVRGDDLARKRLLGSAKTIRSVEWVDRLPVGFDIRDWVVVGAVRRKIPRRCWKSLNAMVGPGPLAARLNAPAGPVQAPKKAKSVPWSEVARTFGKWLHMPDYRGLAVCCATVLSNRIQGDPVWLFLVATSGGSKTETLTAVGGAEECYMTSSLTPHALVSGAVLPGGKDPSLVPRLDGKVLIVKDFTCVLGLHDTEKESIFSILRDAYDGSCGKDFGNGISRHYTSRFTVIAGVTPTIYEVTDRHRQLGERFLKYFLGSSLDHEEEEAIVLRAMQNVDAENDMRHELRSVTAQFLSSRFPKSRWPMDLQRKLVVLARFGSRMRGHTSRDRFRNELMLSKPTAEVGSRLGKQINKLGLSLAMMNDREMVNEEDYAVLKKVVLDTVPPREMDIVSWLWRHSQDKDDTHTTREIMVGTRYSHTTIGRVLTDLNALGIVDRGGKSNAFTWTLSDLVRQLITGSEVFE